MSKTHVFERFDVRGCACDECFTGVTAQAEFDGDWVKAQDAINREAVLQAQIRTLEVQLKDARAAHAADKARLDSRCIMTTGYDEFGDKTVTEWRGIDLRASIDAAMEAAKDRA
jgi:hypothetical protein